MTSSQFCLFCVSNKETKAVDTQLKQILEMADFVKFAKMRPLPDDNEATMRDAITFVEETKLLKNSPLQTKRKKKTEYRSMKIKPLYPVLIKKMNYDICESSIFMVVTFASSGNSLVYYEAKKKPKPHCRFRQLSLLINCRRLIRLICNICVLFCV